MARADRRVVDGGRGAEIEARISRGRYDLDRSRVGIGDRGRAGDGECAADRIGTVDAAELDAFGVRAGRGDATEARGERAALVNVDRLADAADRDPGHREGADRTV